MLFSPVRRGNSNEKHHKLKLIKNLNCLKKQKKNVRKTSWIICTICCVQRTKQGKKIQFSYFCIFNYYIFSACIRSEFYI